MGGYLPDFSMSVRAADAYGDGLLPLSRIDRAACDRAGLHGLPVAFVRWAAARGGASEWHHTSKRYNRTDFFDLAVLADELADDQQRAELLAVWRAGRAAAAQPAGAVVHRGATVAWLQWPARRGQRPVQREEPGCRVAVTGSTAVVTLPDGTAFTKRLTTAGFRITTREQLAAAAAARAEARRQTAALRRRWTDYAKAHPGGFEQTDYWVWRDRLGRDAAAASWTGISRAELWAALAASGPYYAARSIERLEAGERDVVRVGLALGVRPRAPR